MLTLRPSAERGHADHGWLKSQHSFSFANYVDPKHGGFGNLRVLNEDRIAPGSGFGTHSHQDMEIITYVLDGALAHQDNIGNGTTIAPGDVQRMSAGRGVAHSEFNHLQDQQTHFLQIWLLPNQRGILPSYAQTHFGAADKRGRLCLIASPDGVHGSVSMNASARLYAGLFDADEQAHLVLPVGHLGYVHLARGAMRVNGQALQPGDALLIRDEAELRLDQCQAAEVLVFDLWHAAEADSGFKSA